MSHHDHSPSTALQRAVYHHLSYMKQPPHQMDSSYGAARSACVLRPPPPRLPWRLLFVLAWLVLGWFPSELFAVFWHGPPLWARPVQRQAHTKEMRELMQRGKRDDSVSPCVVMAVVTLSPHWVPLVVPWYPLVRKVLSRTLRSEVAACMRRHERRPRVPENWI